jgi:class 3 adenylate cyclase/tetratricopeptide (TPR) repeat protein
VEASRAIERKVVTALFCDVVGSTELGERLDPEDIDRLLGTYHRLARRRIEANGGTVEKFIGDAVVGVFGAPTVHEDDPARAIRAALAIIRDLEASNLDLHVRIGIQTGEAVVRVGEERTAEEGLATGDILNTAARLQNVASPGGIAVGDPTHRAASAEFDWEDLGEVSVKGKAQPVQVWRPLRTHRDEPAQAPEATEFVGRDRELDVVIAAFDRAAASRRIELVTIVAEAGMGKSRLVRELRRRVERVPVKWLKGRCLPYGDGVSFWALGEIVKSHAGILETDDQETIGAKLEASVTDPDPAIRAWLRDRLAPLVSLRTDAAAAAQEETFSAWSRYLTSLAVDGPAVLVFEDLHWADEALVAFLGHLADLDEPVPVLVVVTARPAVSERHPEWLVRAAKGTLVQLVSLDDTAVRALIESTLAGASESLIATVLERAAGSPLYAEQLAALARERGLSTSDASLDASAIPLTIQALLAARIDALPRELKPALLDASVIGRVFWSGAVATVESGDRAVVEPSLEQLATRELTRAQIPSTMLGEAEYAFWHALLRDVAYSFLPRAARLTKHRAAAAWIRDRAGGTLGDLAEIVADHLRRALELATATGADDDLPAIRSELADTLLAAAEHTMGIEPVRSVAHLRTALDLLAADDPRRPGALSELGKALMARAQYVESAAAFEAAVSAYRSRGDDVTAAKVAIDCANALMNAGDSGRAEVAVAAARPILEANPGAGLVDLHVHDAVRAARGDNVESTVAAADRAIELAERLGLPRPYRAVAQRGLVRIAARDPKGEIDVREGIELAMAAGDKRYAVACMANRAATLPRASEALEGFEEALALAARYGLADGTTRGLRFDTLDLAGHWDEVLEEAPALLAEARGRGDAVAEFMINMVRTGIQVSRGEVPDSVDDLVAQAAAIGFRRYVPAAVVVMAAFARGDHAAARRGIVEALESIPDGEHIVGTIPLIQTALAMGDLPLARQVLGKTVPALSEGGRSGLSELAIGLVLEAEGDLAGALHRFETSHAFLHEHGWVEAGGQALAGIGRCRIALGDAPAGLDALRGAREIAASLKVPSMLDAIDDAMQTANALA